MDLGKKIEVAAKAIESIARHDDEDSSLRSQALDQVVATVNAEKAAMVDRLKKRAADVLPTA